MTLVQLAISIVKKFTQMPESEVGVLHTELETDWNKTISDPGHELYKPTLKAKIKEATSGPWTRLFVALVYIPLVRWITEYMNPQIGDTNEDENPLKRN